MNNISRIISSGLLLLVCFLSIACNTETDVTRAKKGDTVQVHYTGKLDDGTIFDSSSGKDPLEFTIGSGKVISGFDTAVINMGISENKTVKIAAADAYGPYDKTLVYLISSSNLAEGVVPEIGMKLHGTNKDGKDIVATITKISDTSITLDANNPLAGKDLTFEIQLVNILPKK